MEMDEAYGVSRRIARGIPIGDDGGGRMLIYMQGEHGEGLYLAGYGDLDREDCLWLTDSLSTLLVNAQGLAAL